MKHHLVKFTNKFELPYTEDVANDLFRQDTADEEEPSEPCHNLPQSCKAPSDQKYYDEGEQDDDNLNYIDSCYMLNAPQTYNNTTTCDDAPLWKQALGSAMKSLLDNDTFDVTELPHGRRAIGEKWVYPVKGKGDYKARYVAKGFVHGVDYFETFSPTVRMETVGTLAPLVVQYGLVLNQMDGKGAYLHAPIDSEIYID